MTLKILLFSMLATLIVTLSSIPFKQIKKYEFYRACRFFLPILALGIVIKSFIATTYIVPTSSMKPTLEKGAFVITSLLNYNINIPILDLHAFSVARPDYSDIVSFVPPNQNKMFVKRVIGLPGDQVKYTNKTLFVNGAPITTIPVNDDVFDVEYHGTKYQIKIDNEYINSKAEGIWQLEHDQYFLVGDNRDHSFDSRFFGPVDGKAITGAVFSF